MTYNELVREMSKEIGVNETTIKAVIQNLAQNIIGYCKDGEEITVLGFGKFKWVEGKTYNYVDFRSTQFWKFKK